MDFTPRVLLVIVLIIGGFYEPLLWLGAIVVAFTIYAESRPMERSLQDGRFPVIEEDSEDWLSALRNAAESPAEVAFLDAMVEAFHLKPRERALRGDGLVLRLQVEEMRYRMDFLVDEALVVEIDGAQWHGSEEAKERDAMRDTELSRAGYTVLRIPAKTALQNPKMAVQLVRNKRAEARAHHERNTQEKSRALRASMNPVNLLSTANTKMTRLAELAEEASRLSKEYRDQEIAKIERARLADLDEGEIARINREALEVIDIIAAEFPPDYSAERDILRMGSEAVWVRERRDEILWPTESPPTVRTAKARLSSLKSYLDVLRKWRDLEIRSARSASSVR